MVGRYRPIGVGAAGPGNTTALPTVAADARIVVLMDAVEEAPRFRGG
jgi:hypothetical protein